ncbi:MAG: glycosyltransferase family 9 protein [Chitinophagaceae bacterium]
MTRFLIIQTAFLGDVVLATALVEKLHSFFPDAKIDFLLRKGNESILANNPKLHKVHVWDKSSKKFSNLLKVATAVRRQRYDCVINVHRGVNSGFITWFSKAKDKRGFEKNPFQWCYTERFLHSFSKREDKHFIHEVERNQQLIASLTDEVPAKPGMYPSEADFQRIQPYLGQEFVCIAPSSVWFTKRFPPERWVELIKLLPSKFKIFLLGAKEDEPLAQQIMQDAGQERVSNLCGKLSIMQSAALMSRAAMNYTNDSGPMHFASAVNAPTTVVYCSTHPCFGFGPLADYSRVVQVEGLYCKPCGLHGFATCPEGHFRCAKDLKINELLWWISPTT